MPDFEFKETNISGLLHIKPRYFEDERGHFLKYFEKEIFREHKLPTVYAEDFESRSAKGTLRGIHFQREYPQAKLVRVPYGAVYAVAVDLRKGSKTLGKWQAFELNDENKEMLFIPEGMGSSFLCLKDGTLFSYKCTDRYSAKYESGVIWNDPDLGIEWPVKDASELIISDRDTAHQSFAEYLKTIE